MLNGQPAAMEVEEEVLPSQLQVGMFVRLPSGWMDHPFLFNQFRITSEKQLAILRSLGLATIIYVPSKSTAAPLPAPAAAPAEPAAASAPTPEQLQAAAEKRRRIERIAEQRSRIARCEKQYLNTANQIRDVMRNIHAESERAVMAARELVGGVVDTFTAEAELVIHLMGDRVVDENIHFHALNIMILSLLLGRACKLPPAAMRILGEGALFHDVGKARVPDAVLRNPMRNRHEEEFYRLHTVYGGEMVRNLGLLSPQAVAIVESHHETLDGKGFPKGLAGDKVPVLARIVGLVNRYDNLCNPLQADKGMTPAEAMGHMFKSEQARWGAPMLQAFIRVLGIYPPGSLVQLSNGIMGVVVSVDHADLLRPSVLIYDPGVPKNEALIVDLVAETDVKVDHVVPPAQMPPEVLRYLAPRRRLSYYHTSKNSA